MQEEENWRMIERDSASVFDVLEATTEEICEIDARLQFVIKQSFSFTRLQSNLAQKFELKLQHHVHDCILYRLLIEDLHICTFCLLGIVQSFGLDVVEGWEVLVKELYILYSPFIDCYVPDNDTGISWIHALLQEAKGMRSHHIHSFIC